MQHSQDHIIHLFIANKDRAIDIIYDQYASNLYGYILQMVGDDLEAQDVLQASFVKIWKNALSYNSAKSKLFTWLLTICRNTAIDHLRSKKHKRDKEIQNKELFVYNSITHTNPDVMDLAKHLNTLEEKYKEVILLLFFKGFTQKEASEHLNIPIGTIKTRLKIGIRELKNIYLYKGNNIAILLLLLWMTE